MRHRFTLALSVILVVSAILLKDPILDELAARFPNQATLCLRDTLTRAVHAQSCYTPAGIVNSFSAWQSDGKLRGTNLFHDTVNNRVGVGTSAPWNTFHVNGTMRTTGRYYSNEWIEFPNATGLYSPNNSAHFYPNNGSYGSWRVIGQRGGWYGLEFDTAAGQTSFLVGTTSQGWGSQQTGFHNNSQGWIWRFDHGTLAVGSVPWARLSSLPSFAANANNGRVRMAEVGCAGWWGSSCDGNNNGYVDYADQAGSAGSAGNSGRCDIDGVCEVHNVYFNNAYYVGNKSVSTIAPSTLSNFMTINNYTGGYNGVVHVSNAGIVFCQDYTCNYGPVLHSGENLSINTLVLSNINNSGTAYLLIEGGLGVSGSVNFYGDSNSIKTPRFTEVSATGVQFKHSSAGLDNWLRIVKGNEPGQYHDLAVGQFYANGAVRFDLAEVTPVDPAENLKIGELVSYDPKGNVRVLRAGGERANDAFGVVSHGLTASMVIGGGTSPEKLSQAKDKRPIALAGRVVTLVNTEHGAILPGDPITASRVKGYGAKLVSDGYYVGRAMEAFDGSRVNSPGVEEIVSRLITESSDPALTEDEKNEYRDLIDQLTEELPPGSGRIITFVGSGYSGEHTVAELQNKVDKLQDEVKEMKKLLQKILEK
ncbi:MAG: hypothetical protein N2691_04810 [Patescibacteria group bacterium]|nr:hypothetical protein [Patescibacteria group bacterium]